MALGLVLLGLAYVVMVIGATHGEAGALVSPWFLVVFYFLFSCGELCFLPVGISFVSQTALFLIFVVLCLLAGGLLWLMVPRLKRLTGDQDPRLAEARP